MKRFSLILGLCVLAPLQVSADEMYEGLDGKTLRGAKREYHDTLSSDRRIRTFEYDADRIYVIRARYGYQTNIEFSRTEEIQTISVGDRSLWQIVPAGHRLFIRPMDENMTTNMTIITSKRSYQFDLKADAVDDKAPIIYVARFDYPKPKTARPAPQGWPANAPFAEPSMQTAGAYPTPLAADGTVPPEQAPTYGSAPNAATPGSPARPNFDYTYSGMDSIAPSQVYDDGTNTYMQFADMNAKMPDVYFITPEGMEKLARSKVRNDTLVIEGVASELMIKTPEGKVFIYNEAAQRL